ncbi:hypothetical protein DL764_010202 [Monosporascus ibericus]|uniref:Integrase catalytic domain-containing protein n=1 Tax=Monosporascus ibericus TaxID=155417 RepID=A0A4Q4ST76_9PEZI|nr:hypothetical protein DL764_010202 [Monosporascus ibericus]
MSDDPIPKDVILKDRFSYPNWFLSLRFNALSRGVWHLIDPDAPDVDRSTGPRKLPLLEEYTAEANAQRKKQYAQALVQWENSHLDIEQRGPTPEAPKELQATDLKEQYEIDLKRLEADIREESREASRIDAKYTNIQTWISATVESQLLRNAQVTLVIRGKITIQDLLRELRDQLAPSPLSTITTWYRTWFSAYTQAKAYDLEEVKGTLAAKDFLSSVSKRLAPAWANSELTNLIRDDSLGRPTMTLQELGAWFSAMCHENNLRTETKDPGIFATLSQGSPSGSGATPNPSADSSPKEPISGHKYPCLATLDQTHKWEPLECALLRLAITGVTTRRITHPSQEDQKGIRERFKLNSNNGGNNTQFGNITAALIDPHTLEALDPTPGIYTTIHFGKHPLSQSTLIDNYGARHLVNTRDLLVPGTFMPDSTGQTVEAGSSSLPISGTGERVIKGALLGASGKPQHDLILKDVVVVEGFHVNIVSEALLKRAGIWYCGLDCSLRKGEINKSVVLAKLTQVHNLAFLEYKPLSSYSSSPPVIPQSPAGILMLPTIRRKKEGRPWRRSRDPPRPRKGTEKLWHLRSGHLGPEALRALVKNARNVIIEGTKRLKCESCARTHASEVISRRSPESRAPRPFWRIAWDYFDYPVGFDGSRWLLVIKDEYSGKLFAFPTADRLGETTFRLIRDFEHWVRRQYRLPICKIKQDNDTGTIAINGLTNYQVWCIEEGIELETAPPYTKEPVGGSERAGQELINRALRMRLGANLPKDLWPEAVKAAAWLYNMSPSHAHDLRSPNEVLARWFKQYFRWYDPVIVNAITADLRPNWSGIFAYGARAYPLTKDREAGREKRAFKVEPRAHIGYLVGFRASNIYRIWVPELRTVITTRNVEFDEDIFYQPEKEKEEALAPAISRELAEDLQISEEIPEEDLVFDILDAWDGLHNDHSTLETAESSAPEPEDLTGGQPEGQNSGVGELAGKAGVDRGLLTPENTPNPESEVQGGAQESEPQPLAESIEPAELPQAACEEDGMEESSREVHSTGPTGESAYSPPSGIRLGTPIDEERTGDQGSPAPRARKSKKSKGKQPQAPTRRSERLRKRENPDGTVDGGAHSVNATVIFGSSEMCLALDRNWEDVIYLFPLLQHAAEQGHEELYTFHAVIAAGALQKQAERLGAAPSRPKIHRDQLAAKPPKHWKDLEKHPLGDAFREDAKKEIEALTERGVWKEIPITQAKSKLIPLKWVFTYKFDKDGWLERCKSRICVRGDLQEADSIISTYAATLAARSFRTVMAIAAKQDLEARQYDVVTAFLNALREGQPTVTCALPEGFKKSGMCAELESALYGLRDSPLLWYREFSSTLQRLGLTPSPEEPCLFYNEQRTVVLMFFVDDLLLFHHRKHQSEADTVVLKLKGTYELKDQGEVSWFLGIRVIRDRSKRQIILAHDSYIEKIAARFGLANDAFAPPTPLGIEELVSNSGIASKEQIKGYQERVGSILYTAVMIRPDVAFAASLLSKFLSNPSVKHIKAANRVIRYLFHTRFLAIVYGGASGEAQALLIAGDASFADDPETRRSSQGYIMTLFGGPVVWKAARQATVTTSTTEAELLALEHTAKEAMALKRLFRDLRLELGQAWEIFCDNQQAIRLVVGENERITTRLRHVDTQNMWLRQEQSRGSFNVTYLPTAQMPADGLTKALPRQQFEHFRSLLNLQDSRQVHSGDREHITDH